MRVSPAARGMIAASLALGLLAGCSKPPSATSPSPGVTVPVNPSLNTNLPSDLSGSHVAPVTAVPASPVVAAPLAAAPVGLAAGAPPPLIPFVSYINGDYKLFVYDPTINDNYALPGAGDGIHNPQIFSGNRIVFDRNDGGTHHIYFYDVVAELVATFNDVNGLGDVRKPSISFDGTVMTFLLDQSRAMIWINGVVADIAKINTVAALNSTYVTWLRLSCDGQWIVFTTADGGLYLYDVVNPMVNQITAARDVGDGFATHPAISPDGTQIAWESDGKVFRYDRVTGLVDPMPFLNTAFNADFVTDPLWECFDNAHILAELGTFGPPLTGGQGIVSAFGPVFAHVSGNATVVVTDPDSFPFESQINYGTAFTNGLPAFGFALVGGTAHCIVEPVSVIRVVSYNWITETVQALSVLNSVLGSGDNQISDISADPSPSP